MVATIKHLLTTVGMDYVLPGKIQSGRLEAEFDIYCQSSGENYLTHVS